MLGLARQIDEPAFQRREARQKIRAHRVQLFIQRLQTLFGRPPRFAKQQFSHLFDWIPRGRDARGFVRLARFSL